MSSDALGSVAGLWRFPVKSMKGEQLEQVELTPSGLVGDRAYALIDVDTGKVVSAKHVNLFPTMLDCRAAFDEPPKPGGELPPVRITLPDNSTVTSDSSSASQRLSSFFGRNVKLAQTATDDFIKSRSAFLAGAGLNSPAAVGAFCDLFPLSVVTNSTLDRLNEIRPESRFDPRRFRMNVIVDATDGGFVETNWIGHTFRIGYSVRFHVTLPDPRCVLTTFAQDELPKDNDILRTLAQHNMIQVGDAGEFPCVGVYAVVETPGTIQTGDRVSLS
jgi:MOSC domain-containing protein